MCYVHIITLVLHRVLWCVFITSLMCHVHIITPILHGVLWCVVITPIFSHDYTCRTDWEYVFNTFAFGYAIGYHFIETSTGSMNGNFLGIGSDLSVWKYVLCSIGSVHVMVMMK